MSRYVKVAALGPVQMAGQPATDEEAVEKAIEWWRMHLEQVWPDEPDLVVLPEACDRFPEFPLERRRAYYEYRGDRVRDFLAGQAREHRCCIAYSAARQQPGGLWCNTTEIIDRGGKTAGQYHKNHITVGEYEAGLQYGAESPLIRCDFGTVACAICFDLNFEELRDRYRVQRPDLIVFCSMYHGGLAQKIWAYECQAYFVGAVTGLRCDVLSPQGESIAASSSYGCHVAARINLDRELVHLDFNGEKLAAAKRKYRAKIGISIPDYLGSVLLTSELEEHTVQDVMREFGMASWREYHAASEKHREEHLPK
jgi:predicted amidohydrolase